MALVELTLSDHVERSVRVDEVWPPGATTSPRTGLGAALARSSMLESTCKSGFETEVATEDATEKKSSYDPAHETSPC